MAASGHEGSRLRHRPSLATAMKAHALLLIILLNIVSRSYAETSAFGAKISLLCQGDAPCEAMLEQNNETLVCELPRVSASTASRFRARDGERELSNSTVCGAVRFRVGTSMGPLSCTCDSSRQPRILCPILQADTTKAGLYVCQAQFLRNASEVRTIGPGDVTLPVIGTLLQPNASVTTLANRTLLFTALPSARYQKNRSIANRGLYFRSAVFVRQLTHREDGTNSPSTADNFAAELAQAVVNQPTDQPLPGNAMLACELLDDACEWQVPESEATSEIVTLQYVYVIATARQLFYVQDDVRVNMTGLNSTLFVSNSLPEDNMTMVIWIICCVSAVVAVLVAGAVSIYRWCRQEKHDRKLNVPTRPNCTIHTSGEYGPVSQTNPNLVSVKE